jgi:hypothetical protein
MGSQDRNNFRYDVVLTFAGEDRPVAEELARLLSEKGIKTFYDEFEKADLWGKNLYDHLADIYSNQARFCIMLISSHYARKLWTNHERENAQARAFRENQEYILPIKLDDTTIPGLPPTIGYIDLRHSSVEEIVGLVAVKLGRLSGATEQAQKAQPVRKVRKIELPRIKKSFTQRDRDRFLHEAFEEIKQYFEQALSLLEEQVPEAETDFIPVHNLKFVGRVYIHGNQRHQCKVWLGSMLSSEGIGYTEGNFSIDTDNSYNEMFHVVEDDSELKLGASFMTHIFSSEKKVLAKEEAAEYLWQRFTAFLGYSN